MLTSGGGCSVVVVVVVGSAAIGGPDMSSLSSRFGFPFGMLTTRGKTHACGSAFWIACGSSFWMLACYMERS